MTQANAPAVSPAVSPASATSLFIVNQATKKDQLAQLKFFAILVGASVASLDKATRVQQVYDALKGCYKSKEAAALLQSMLCVIGVDAEKVAGLGSRSEDLKDSKEVEGFEFGELMVTICKNLNEDKFTGLKDLFADDLSDPPHKINSADELFLKLIRAEIVMPQNLKKLIDNLEAIERKDLAQLAQKFRRQVTGAIGQATDDGDTGMLMVGLPAQTQVSLLTNGALGENVGDDRNGDDERDRAGRIEQPHMQNEEQDNEEQEPQTDGDKTKPYKREFQGRDQKMKQKPKLRLYDKTRNKMENLTISTEPVSRPASLVGVYPMTKREHGVVLIISNRTFTAHDTREGTEVDERNLVETFRYLGYRINVKHNCKNSQIVDLFQNIGDLVKDEDDSFVCCILSHGGNNYVYGTDGHDANTESRAVVLRTENNSLEMKLKECEKLAGKPKLFFCSCCRGSTTGDRWTGPQYDGPQRRIPKRGDFAFYYSTLTGEPSVRYPDKGTVYISALCHRLCEHATHATLSDIQKMVADEVSQLGYHNQVPCSEEQLFKNVYFFEDMIEDNS